MHQLQQKLIVA